MAALRWDLFCRVIDNFGDAGVSWRVARRLAELGDDVRLWIDDPRPLQFMAPQGHPGVTVVPWQTPLPDLTPGDVVIEAFGCDPPDAFVERMARADAPPVWINLEYFTAETQAERNHGLPSPQRCGLTKWFFYPGLTPLTGGLLREAAWLERRQHFDRAHWLRSQGVPYQEGDRVVSLFCYDHPRLPAWWAWLAQHPTHLLVTPGYAAEQARKLARLPSLRVHELPWLTQDGFDELLWASDLNGVRGEDSVVRALLAGRPLLWQIYPQDDQAHASKLNAFLQWYFADAPPALAQAVSPALQHWAGVPGGRLTPFGDALQAAWVDHARAVTRRIADLPELGQSLRDFALERRHGIPR